MADWLPRCACARKPRLLSRAAPPTPRVVGSDPADCRDHPTTRPRQSPATRARAHTHSRTYKHLGKTASTSICLPENPVLGCAGCRAAAAAAACAPGTHADALPRCHPFCSIRSWAAASTGTACPPCRPCLPLLSPAAFPSDRSASHGRPAGPGLAVTHARDARPSVGVVLLLVAGRQLCRLAGRAQKRCASAQQTDR